ncbi:NAD-dependent epimerase/dehydratase family protein [Bradyrhizobium ganzhouense]|uniref:NAD-dependent epimerase/dehydratase family protein n=1 Tax=Bradyrhizobium ganzhouense TaxID=1179767 RepID=UPI003CE6E954
MLTELGRHDAGVVASGRPGGAPAGSDTAKFRWLPLDLADPSADCFATLHRANVWLHLAWDGLPKYRSQYHVETELPRHVALLENAVRNGLSTLVVAGTCLEYGLQSGALAAVAETRPTMPYGVAKDTLRQRLQALQADCPFGLTWARLFYMYGDGQPAGSLWPSLKAAALAGRDKFPMSGGEQLRDFVETRIRQNGWSIRPKYGEMPYADCEPMAFWGKPSGSD